MTSALSRRGFCVAAAVAAFSSPPAQRAALAASAPPADSPPEPGIPVDDVFPSTDRTRAREIVGASHRDIDKVRALLAEDRSLALATYDWGFGDWESALGAASHVGRREIAELLMAHGARPDIFTFAMLDRVDAVRALCEAMPGIQRTRGPHGITLLRHAKNGEAARVEEYLTALGDADHAEPLLETSAEEGARYLGTYAWEGGGEARLVVEAGRGGIGILRRGANSCSLRRTGDHAFSPAGAPHVTVRFTMEGGRATALAIERPRVVLSAVRVEG